MKQLGLEGAKGVCSPGTKEEGTTKDDRERELQAEQATAYRAMVARLNYLAADRPDLAFSVKEFARTMSKPTRGCWDKLKRMGRYLVEQPRAIVHYGWQKVPNKLRVFTDADWAGCKIGPTENQRICVFR